MAKKREPRKKGKENPKAQEALRELQFWVAELLHENGYPKRLPPDLRSDWDEDPVFRLSVWCREMRKRAQELPDRRPDLACSALLQGYLRIIDVKLPAGVFRDDLESAGRGRKPTVDARALVRERAENKSFGQIGRRHFAGLDSRIAYIKARDRVKTAESRLRRASPLDGPLFDQVCRMLGLKTRDEDVEDYIRRIEAGEFAADENDTEDSGLE